MWKSEYATRRRQKYQSDSAEREKRKRQCRSSAENKLYMSQYYKSNKSKYKLTKEQLEARSADRRQRYRDDAVYREKKKAQVKAGRARNPQTRLSQILRKYGLTINDYDRLLSSQNGKCAICLSQKHADKRNKRFHVDHCHKTGLVRGLLCSSCNLGLGQFGDDPEMLKMAAFYLESAMRRCTDV